MHKEVKNFCLSVKHQFPQFFTGVDVLDCGSLDINGNNRYLFDKSNYFGIDIVEGRNVDLVTRIHDFKTSKQFDCVISTEMLEHDEYFADSLNAMFNLLKPGGLLLITAAGCGRKEHGTHEHTPQDSPLTPDYYHNVDVTMLVQGLDLTKFSWYTISYLETDIRFAGIKILTDEN
ncbi:MAG: class I SAM-dependent methyltransferase [Bacteroidales bacterium]|nr:class I SAM-dependent methyltransferase [Bacteroidales bacterium]